MRLWGLVLFMRWSQERLFHWGPEWEHLLWEGVSLLEQEKAKVWEAESGVLVTWSNASGEERGKVMTDVKFWAGTVQMGMLRDDCSLLLASSSLEVTSLTDRKQAGSYTRVFLHASVQAVPVNSASRLWVTRSRKQDMRRGGGVETMWGNWMWRKKQQINTQK
jgi:hypothetical protein